MTAAAGVAGCGAFVAASWYDAKRVENEQLLCAMKPHKRADGPLDVREGPRGKVCVYHSIDGRPVQTLPLGSQ